MVADQISSPSSEFCADTGDPTDRGGGATTAAITASATAQRTASLGNLFRTVDFDIAAELSSHL
jgi:hypothetical protein